MACIKNHISKYAFYLLLMACLLGVSDLVIPNARAGNCVDSIRKIFSLLNKKPNNTTHIPHSGLPVSERMSELREVVKMTDEQAALLEENAKYLKTVDEVMDEEKSLRRFKSNFLLGPVGYDISTLSESIDARLYPIAFKSVSMDPTHKQTTEYVTKFFKKLLLGKNSEKRVVYFLIPSDLTISNRYTYTVNEFNILMSNPELASRVHFIYGSRNWSRGPTR